MRWWPSPKARRVSSRGRRHRITSGLARLARLCSSRVSSLWWLPSSWQSSMSTWCRRRRCTLRCRPMRRSKRVSWWHSWSSATLVSWAVLSIMLRCALPSEIERNKWNDLDRTLFQRIKSKQQMSRSRSRSGGKRKASPYARFVKAHFKSCYAKACKSHGEGKKAAQMAMKECARLYKGQTGRSASRSRSRRSRSRRSSRWNQSILLSENNGKWIFMIEMLHSKDEFIVLFLLFCLECFDLVLLSFQDNDDDDNRNNQCHNGCCIVNIGRRMLDLIPKACHSIVLFHWRRANNCGLVSRQISIDAHTRVELDTHDNSIAANK